MAQGKLHSEAGEGNRQEVNINETMGAQEISREGDGVIYVLMALEAIIAPGEFGETLTLSGPDRQGLARIIHDARERVIGIAESAGNLSKREGLKAV